MYTINYLNFFSILRAGGDSLDIEVNHESKIKNYIRKISLASKFIHYSTYVGMVEISFSILVLNGQLPFECWYPFDITSSRLGYLITLNNYKV